MPNALEKTVTPGLIMLLYVSACHGQIEPDGDNCAICGDTGHQAFDCHLNAFYQFVKACFTIELRVPWKYLEQGKDYEQCQK